MRMVHVTVCAGLTEGTDEANHSEERLSALITMALMLHSV